jgi:ectoine hydroxylase-related dioxygenase (phytanoyl-CoA dioxygenase family)
MTATAPSVSSTLVTTPAGIPLHEHADADFVAQYRRDGFAILRQALSPADLDDLRAETVRLVRGELGEIGGNTPVVSPEDSDEDVMRKYLCIHFPHKLSAVCERFIHQPSIVDALTKVIGPDVKAMQSMLFIKAEGKPGQAWHQDEFYIPSRDRSITAAWIAVDDANVDNGCLWVIPGSHAPGVIYPDREHDDERFDCSVELYDFPYTDADAVPVEVPAGAAVIFNGYLLHRSLPNNGVKGFRRSYVNHYMSAQSLLPWQLPREGEHMAKADLRDIVMVAGKDPYAYKGLEDVHKAWVRPDREGGCAR